MQNYIYLVRILRNATQLVIDAATEQIKFSEFLGEYDNFYHRAALDGHENSDVVDKLRKQFKSIVELHARVQFDVVDQYYVPPSGTSVAYVDRHTGSEHASVASRTGRGWQEIRSRPLWCRGSDQRQLTSGRLSP